MAGKKVTLKDIAREANVSTATVSYVLNYSEKEKISHETRLRIFEAARKLDYVPNMNAKSLASKKSFLVGIVINMEEGSRRSKIYQYYDLAVELQRILYPIGYDVILLPTAQLQTDISIGRKRSLDAVFVVDMDAKSFRAIANQFYVPAIFIDGYVEDPLFCKIGVDYGAVLTRAGELLGPDFYVVMEDYSNQAVLQAVEQRVAREDIFVNREGADLIEFLGRRTGRGGLVLGELLGMQVENFVDNQNLCVMVSSDRDGMLLPDTKKILVSSRAKAAKAVEVMEGLLSLVKADEVQRLSLIGPE